MAGKRRGQQVPTLGADESEDEAVDRFAEEIIESEGAHADEGSVTVDLDEEDDEEPEPQPGQPGSRDTKRRNRWADLRASEAREREGRERAERELAAERARLQTLQETRVSPPQGPAAPPPEDPTIAEEQRIMDEMQQEQESYRRQLMAAAVAKTELSAEDHQRFRKKYAELDNKRVNLLVSRQMDRRLAEERERQPQQPTPEGLAAQNLIVTRFPQLANADGGRYVAVKLQARVIAESMRTRQRVAPTLPMLEEVCKEAMRELGYATPPAPTKSMKATFSGMGGGPKTNGKANGKRLVTLSPEEKRMARARFRGLPEKDAYRRFAQEMAEPDDN